MGTNILIGSDYDRLEREVSRALSGNFKKGSIPPLWDGNAADRIAELLLDDGKADDGGRCPRSAL